VGKGADSKNRIDVFGGIRSDDRVCQNNRSIAQKTRASRGAFYRSLSTCADTIKRVVAPSSMMLGTILLVVAAESVTSAPFVGAYVLRASHQLFLGGSSPPPHSLYMNMGVDASNIYCDSPGSELPMCAYGADCVDCAPRMPRSTPQPPVSSPPRPIASTPPAPAAPPALCINTVTYPLKNVHDFLCSRHSIGSDSTIVET
jgi:hypothetical protein